jgi:hypothetical protein
VDSDEGDRRLQAMVYEQQAVTDELRRRMRSVQLMLGLVMVGVGLALVVAGLWLGLRTTSFGQTDCGHPLAATNPAFGDTPPSDVATDNDIP